MDLKKLADVKKPDRRRIGLLIIGVALIVGVLELLALQLGSLDIPLNA